VTGRYTYVIIGCIKGYEYYYAAIMTLPITCVRLVLKSMSKSSVVNLYIYIQICRYIFFSHSETNIMVI